MKRAAPWESYPISSDDSSGSDYEDDKLRLSKKLMSEGALIRRAEMYQEYMQNVPIPLQRGSVIPFTSWQGIGQSVKQLYRQPLHYLTNILLKKWDLSRIGSKDEQEPLDTLVHPSQAEALVWVTEEVHRLTSSHHYLAKLWGSDHMYHACIDSIFP